MMMRMTKGHEIVSGTMVDLELKVMILDHKHVLNQMMWLAGAFRLYKDHIQSESSDQIRQKISWLVVCDFVVNNSFEST